MQRETALPRLPYSTLPFPRARTVLACLSIMILPVATFGPQVAAIPEADVQNAITYFDRGLAKQRKGDLDGAMADYNQAIKLNPKDANAYNNRGNVKSDEGRSERGNG